jgi:hypothetical protein
MSWLVDHANTWYLLLGLLTVGLVLAWWLNRRVKFLGFAGGVLVLMGLLWLLSSSVNTDRKQLEHAVKAMAAAVEKGDANNLFKHIARDFRYKGMDRDALHKHAQQAVQVYEVREIKITKFTVDEVSREKKFAKTSFRCSVWSGGNDTPDLLSIQADFVLEDGAWKLKTLRFYNPIVNQDQEIDLPLP